MNLTKLSESYSAVDTDYIRDNWPAIEAQMIEQAKACQDACNGCGVSNLLRVCYALALKKGGTDYANRHPAVKGILGKLCSLAMIDHNATDAYGEMYDYKEG